MLKRINFPMPNLAIWVGDSVTNVQMALYCAWKNFNTRSWQNLSSVVVHHVDGHLTAKAKNQIAFLASKEDESDTSSKPRNYFGAAECYYQRALGAALATLPKDSPSAELSKLFESIFPEQRLYAGPLQEVGSIQEFNRTFDAARCEDVFKAFQGRIWKDLIYSCCLNVVENGVKLYKIRMSEGLGTIINTPDLKGVTQALSPAKKVEN
ncbi:unnamed protein product [Peronospora farinosa]|uniref:Uncharacterized protein n=1 Tax=Peronospora farinosa TaxID=134698 RepID=A0ABN8CFA6_9STRA|nr:unnamed protein product [Peronospora farinosa]